MSLLDSSVNRFRQEQELTQTTQFKATQMYLYQSGWARSSAGCSWALCQGLIRLKSGCPCCFSGTVAEFTCQAHVVFQSSRSWLLWSCGPSTGGCSQLLDATFPVARPLHHQSSKRGAHVKSLLCVSPFSRKSPVAMRTCVGQTRSDTYCFVKSAVPQDLSFKSKSRTNP